jgi:hypothetical protein
VIEPIRLYTVQQRFFVIALSTSIVGRLTSERVAKTRKLNHNDFANWSQRHFAGTDSLTGQAHMRLFPIMPGAA